MNQTVIESKSGISVDKSTLSPPEHIGTPMFLKHLNRLCNAVEENNELVMYLNRALNRLGGNTYPQRDEATLFPSSGSVIDDLDLMLNKLEDQNRFLKMNIEFLESLV